ncbi:hypothetical protein BYT27DRAFT_6434151 [Phlegmacium glaucopus]|nr:hypothetical protein BYT27DRAFT_6434151 [Phlegmacium glaucopus]
MSTSQIQSHPFLDPIHAQRRYTFFFFKAYMTEFILFCFCMIIYLSVVYIWNYWVLVSSRMFYYMPLFSVLYGFYFSMARSCKSYALLLPSSFLDDAFTKIMI